MAIDFGSIDHMQGGLSFQRARQEVLASNVANLDTPGYRPLDLDRTIDAATGATDPDSFRTFDDGGQLVSPDGNAVQLERELAKMDANRTCYATTAELVSRRFALLKYAAGDGG